MKTSVHVQTAAVEQLREFVEAEGIGIEPVTDPACDVTIAPGDKGRCSDLTTIYAGGSIACATAFELAAKLGISQTKMGKLLDHLDVKVRDCQLGCFGRPGGVRTMP